MHLPLPAINKTGTPSTAFLQFFHQPAAFLLTSLVARDQMDIVRSVEDEHKAVEIAFRLKNAELIASSLLRRARIYIRQQDYVLAYQDAMQMLPYADLSRDPLKGKCYQMAGEATGYVAVNDSLLQKKSMDYFNRALKIAQKGDMTPDGSFVRTDITSILIEKADVRILSFEQEETALFFVVITP